MTYNDRDEVIIELRDKISDVIRDFVMGNLSVKLPTEEKKGQCTCGK